MKMCDKDRLLLIHATSVLKELEKRAQESFKTTPFSGEQKDGFLDNAREAKKSRNSINFLLEKEEV